VNLAKNGRKKRGVFIVGKGKLEPNDNGPEYQLVDEDGRLYEKGKWI
jgi:hypothetical protein